MQWQETQGSIDFSFPLIYIKYLLIIIIIYQFEYNYDLFICFGTIHIEPLLLISHSFLVDSKQCLNPEQDISKDHHF